MNSVLHFYKLPITRELRFKFDDLAPMGFPEEYLWKKIGNFKWVKREDKELRIVLGEGSFTPHGSPNYLLVLNGDSTVLCFFVDSWEWASDMTARVRISLDYLNSFSHSLGARTLTSRKHKHLLGSDGSLLPLDPFPEPFSPKLIKESESYMAEFPCELVYQSAETPTSENPQPINFLCYPKKAIEATKAIASTASFTTSTPTTSFSWVMAAFDNPGGNAGTLFVLQGYGTASEQITGWGGGYLFAEKEYGSRTAICLACSLIWDDGSKYAYCKSFYYYDDYSFAGVEVTKQQGNVISPVLYCQNGTLTFYREATGTLETHDLGEMAKLPRGSLSFSRTTTIKVTSASWADIKRQSTTAQKILFLPILPDLGNDFVLIPNGPYLSSKTKTGGPSAEEFDAGMTIPASEFVPTALSNYVLDGEEVDPKLYASQFSPIKIVCDSFSMTIKREQYSPGTFFRTYFASGFESMTEECYFRGTAPTIGVDEDFPALMSVSRSFSSPVFSSSYLDYMRTGYNYDLKAHAISVRSQWVQFAIGTIGSIASGIAGAATQNQFITANAVSGITSAISKVASIGFGNEQWENSQKARLANLASQGMSVSEISDFSLFRAYSKAVMKIEFWRPIEEEARSISNFFNYYGYACNELGAPGTHVRKFWDHIQCDPDLRSSCLDDDAISHLSDIYRSGVTILHRQDDGSYDFGQENANSDYYNS